MGTYRVAPAVLAPLQDALTAIYWYKPELKTFLNAAVGDRGLVSRLDFSQVKRQIVRELVSTLDANQHKYFDNLVSLLLAVADVKDPTWLKRVDDGQRKYEIAVKALEELRQYVEPYRELHTETQLAEKRQAAAREMAASARAVSEKLAELRTTFESLRSLDPQPRGYALEQFLTGLFETYDIDVKGSFKIRGEQIDGAFTFQGTEYLLEAKWQKKPTPLKDLESFRGKVNRKLDNTLGFFVSINGYEKTAVDEFRVGSRPSVLLADGGDLLATLEERLPLPELLLRKRQHAARTGEVFISAWNLIG